MNGFPAREQVERIKARYPAGTRIRLNSMADPYAPIPPGTEGVVQAVDDAGQLIMKWDNGQGLSLIPGEDRFSVLPPEEEQGMTMTTLPQLSEAFGFLEDIDQLNELAHVFTGFTKEQACIYKAMLNAAPKDITIPEALELSGQIQNFSVIREASTPAEYAQYMLSKYCIEQQDELFSCANLQRYGEKLIAEKGIVLTDYGVLWSMDGQTVEQCLNRESPVLGMEMK